MEVQRVQRQIGPLWEVSGRVVTLQNIPFGSSEARRWCGLRGMCAPPFGIIPVVCLYL
jgi:hypothetical protein